MSGIGFSGSNYVGGLTNGTVGDRPNVLTGSATNSAAAYTGFLNVTTGGSYTFRSGADDGFALYIDGNAIATTTTLSALTDVAAVTTSLTAGYHSIVYKATNAGSAGGFRVLYSGPDTSGDFQTIDSSQLFKTTASPVLANGYNGAAIIDNSTTSAGP